MWFSLREVCSNLASELRSVVGDKNVIRISIDVQLPDTYVGSFNSVAATIQQIAEIISQILINGVIVIEVSRRSDSDGLTNFQIDILGQGLEEIQYSGGDMSSLLSKVQDTLSHLPIPVHSHLSRGVLHFDFKAGFKSFENEHTRNKLPFHAKRILIAEDNQVNAMVFSCFVEEWGCEVAVAVNGSEAVTAVAKHAPDILLMDLHMPVMNGIDAIQAIRKFNASVPIIALTASTMEADLRMALEAGANDNLLKPVSSVHLFNVLSRYL